MNLQLNLSVPTDLKSYLPLITNVPTDDNTSGFRDNYQFLVSIEVPQFIAYLFKPTDDVNDTAYPEVTDVPKDDERAEPTLLRDARHLIQQGSFTLCEEGVGGTYFIRNQDKDILSVFKPIDEEPGAAHNPKQKLSKPLLPAGGGAKREVAAYLLDRGFAGVPQTYFISDIQHPDFGSENDKSGSLQEFVPNVGDSSSMGYSRFIAEDVHRIGILDVRLLNLDRNSENMLVSKQTGINGEELYRLVPIDHTYSLPPDLKNAYFEWMYWPHAKKPFSSACLDFINNINIDDDIAVLESLEFEESSIRTMIACTVLLKKCAALGYNLFQIASLVCCDFKAKESVLEQLVAKASLSPSDHHTFIHTLEEVVDEYLASQ